MTMENFTPAFLLLCLCFDAFCFFKFKHLSQRAAIGFFVFWTSLALLYALFVYVEFNPVKAKEFLAGYALERTLSLDNIFVFYIIFKFFKMPEDAGQRVLFWGILLAIILRIIFIFIGAELIERFAFVMYVFGAFLIFTGIKMIVVSENKERDLEKNFVVLIIKKLIPVTKDYHGDDIFVRKNGLWMATPVFVVLILVAFTDVIFALDSIPAIFAITTQPLVVITANFFSLMGLRAIFSLIYHIIQGFYYLKYSLSVILVFVGVKMMIAKIYHIPISTSLGVIFGCLILGIAASILRSKLLEKG